jgi:hypothetical protein
MSSSCVQHLCQVQELSQRAELSSLARESLVKSRLHVYTLHVCKRSRGAEKTSLDGSTYHACGAQGLHSTKLPRSAARCGRHSLGGGSGIT